jgi:putative ABC transport system permease protein
MPGHVALARRTLFAERRRTALAVTGVAVALLLVLILDGVFAGAVRQVTAYLRTSGADAIVSQRSVRTMHMSSSALPDADIAGARAVPGVAWASPIRYTSGMVTTARDRELAYVIGYTPGAHGGPHTVVAGTAPHRGEAIVDRVAARLLGVHIGDPVQLLGTSFRVSGLTEGTTSITNTIVFITARDFARLRGPAVAYIFVGAKPGVTPTELRDRLAAALPDATVQTRAEFVHEEASLVRDMSADLMRIMTIVALVIALAVIALLLFTTTLAHVRDYGIVKALGGTSTRLTRAVLAQAVWCVALAMVLAVALALGTAAIVDRVSDNVVIAIQPGAVTRLALDALVVATVGALLPLRRITRLDAATAFRRTT